MNRILRAAVRVRCAVEGHDYDEGSPHGFSYVAFVRFECKHCGETREKVAEPGSRRTA